VKRALVVDDEADIRDVLEAILKHLGCEVVLAGTREEALVAVERIGESPLIALALVDLNLRPGARQGEPGFRDGLVVAKACRDRGIAKVHVMTGSEPDQGTLRMLYEMGVALMRKPLLLDDLRRLLAEA